MQKLKILENKIFNLKVRNVGYIDLNLILVKGEKVWQL